MKKRAIVSILSIVLAAGMLFTPMADVYAEDGETKENTKTLSSKMYEYGKDDDYKLSDATSSSYSVQRFTINGKISEVSTKKGVDTYAVDVGQDDNLTIQTKFVGLPESMSNDGWEIVEDSDKAIDTIDLDGKIKNGAYVIQTSRDGKIWVTDVDETVKDYFHSDIKAGDSVYTTTNVQLTSGCYYRIIVAYEIRKQVESSNILFVEKKNYEYKKIAEVYTFYAHDLNVDETDILDVAAKDTKVIYNGKNVVRCEKAEGYSGSQEIDPDDPHKGWSMGNFYISGCTDVRENDENTPVVLKKVGDRVSLWFNLEQDISACDNNTKIEVVTDPENTDNQFIDVKKQDFGKGMLIIKKEDYRGETKTYEYKNFLEASATAEANTRIDLFEEGNYEVALDYALKYSNTTVFGASVLPKTLHYRMYFKFNVRNGDCKLFIRDAATKQFISNSNIAENGFYIDRAKQNYIQIQVKRDVMSESLDGLVPDPKINGVAGEDEIYTDEGVYTITATNETTNAVTEKKIYVGNAAVLKAYVVTGLSVAEINEKLEAGAYIDDDGNLVLPEEQQEIVDELLEEDSVNTEDYSNDETSELANIDNNIEQDIQSTEVEQSSDKTGIIVFIAIVSVVVVWIGNKFLKNKKTKSSEFVDEKKDENEEGQEQ